MAELTSDGNVKITDNGAGAKRFDVDPASELALNTTDLLQIGGVPIVERGSDANGEYIRYADGTQIAVARKTGIGSVTTAFGGGFILSVSSVAWAAAFSETPKVAVSARKTSGNAPIWAAGGTGAATTTNTPTVWLNVWVSSADTGNVIEYIGIGRWF